MAMSNPLGRFLVAVLAEMPPGSVAAFRAYEAAVLPLLGRHGGRLERRLRTADGDTGTYTEIHVVSFGSPDGLAAFRADPDRLRHGPLLDGVDVTQRVLEMVDVVDGEL